MKTLQDWNRLKHLDHQVIVHLDRAVSYARRGMLEAANAEHKRADAVRARRDQLDQETSR